MNNMNMNTKTDNGPDTKASFGSSYENEMKWNGMIIRK